MNLEKALGFFMDFLVWSYGALHLPLIMGTMVWIFKQRRSRWTQFRNWFLAIVATGNHFFVDAIGSVPVLPAAHVLAAGLQTSDVTGTRAVTVREHDG